MLGCSTQKNTAWRRFYHRWTAYFNYYFNAQDAYHQAERNADEQLRYDYTWLGCQRLRWRWAVEWTGL